MKFFILLMEFEIYSLKKQNVWAHTPKTENKLCFLTSENENSLFHQRVAISTYTRSGVVNGTRSCKGEN